MKKDRRVKYTRKVLKEALIELLRERSITEVTVTMLCEKADVNRSTFYAHYDNQFDLLEKIAENVYLDMKKYIIDNQSDNKRFFQRDAMKILVEYTRQNADVFRMLMSRHGKYNFYDLFYRLAKDLSQSEIVNSGGDADKLDYVLAFSVGTCEVVLKKWLDAGMEKSVDEISEMIVKLIYKGRDGLLETIN